MKRRRENEIFSISFLDVITCGFGAIILLLIIAQPGRPPVLEEAPDPLEGVIRDLQQQLFTIRGEATVLNRDLNAKREQLSRHKERVARLQQELNETEQRIASVADESAINAAVKGRLELALQELTEEMQRLLGENQFEKSEYIGGIPVDSEYIIFVIDTSGSMFQYTWNRVLEQVNHILDVYPEVKGLQIMNDMGDYMFSNYRGQWIPDTPARRRVILNRLRTWNPFSNSSPVEGITEAIRTYGSRDKKISLYVMGDDFTGQSVSQVVEIVDKLNPKDEAGNPLVRIHAVGFPVLFSQPRYMQNSVIRFATLMRELTRKNGGAFVGLNDFR
ncbi:MAG: VWA domain-containing protein [Gammaproteobacteria bacterium]